MLKNQNFQMDNIDGHSNYQLRNNQVNNDQGGDESKMIMKPFIYQGPTPGQTMREANQPSNSRLSASDYGGQK